VQLDIQLPDLDGFSVAQRIQQQTRGHRGRTGDPLCQPASRRR
jgi:CheY-like chemotaxis protein